MLKPYHTKDLVEAGCDEAGRGCIAGPVFAGAVILPPDFQHPLLNDSKKLTARIRKEIRVVIEKEALAYGVGIVDEKEIDKINILNASFLAMHRALEKLNTLPGHLVIDGNRFKPFGEIAYTCVVKGDARYASVAAASILAKTYRDDFMEELHHQHPEYGWVQNKGYPTRSHREAVFKFGPTPYHRRSFKLLNDQMSLDFS